MRRALAPMAKPGAWAALLAAAALSGCANPFEQLEAISVVGYLSADLLPADREVGSWRRVGKPGQVLRLQAGDFKESFGEDAFARVRPWGLAGGARAEYRLGDTGRTMTVEVYDLHKARGAFDVYSLIRERQLKYKPSSARITKVGVQGMLSHMEFGGVHGDGPFAKSLLLFWAERFLIHLSQRTPVASDEEAAAAETALPAFGEAVTRKLKQPFELPEVYVLQITGEVPNSERYEPGRLLGRPELAGGVTARWKGRTGEGTLFISVADSPGEAARAFEKLRRAAAGNLTSGYADGPFVGSLPGTGPVVCFRSGKAVAGLAGAAEDAERRAAVEEIRGRCVREAPAPAAEPAAEEAK